jgi:ribosomal protein S14
MLNIVNSNLTIKYIKNSTTFDRIFFTVLIDLLRKQRIIPLVNRKYLCIYTGRYRSVFRSFKMCRHKLKVFFDKNTISNLYVK